MQSSQVGVWVTTASGSPRAMSSHTSLGAGLTTRHTVGVTVSASTDSVEGPRRCVPAHRSWGPLYSAFPHTGWIRCQPRLTLRTHENLTVRALSPRVPPHDPLVRN